MIKKRLRNLALALVALVSVPASAQANQTVIQGVSRDGQGMTLPQALCAYPGQALRLGAMVVDFGGRPVVPPAEWIHWAVVQPNGHTIEWSPAWGPSRGPFRRDPFLERAIQLAMPTRGGFRLRLEAHARRAQFTQIQIVDPRGNSPCRWGPVEMYLN